ncbi:MAG: Propionyl-CoA carboxylase [Frankiales bacterium]|jgi:acetyl-CoA/propionyl-CoA carboxylase carboxyl transferase subunit|nr:Propionyl-CoA carboxylase [Frankiales bacterium]
MTAALITPVASPGAARLTLLFDTWEQFEEVDGAVVGTGLIGGAPAVAFATDPRVQGGALGVDSCAAIVRATDLAVSRGVAVVGIWHSGGARLREGVSSLDAVARVFRAQTAASGRVLQVSVVLGPAAGGAAYGPALTDVVILGPEGRLFVTGPDIVRAVTGEDVDMERLGGAETHTRRSGVVHLSTPTDQGALDRARQLVGLVGRPGLLDTGAGSGPDPRDRVPVEHRKAYDVRPVIDAVLDSETRLELHPDWAPNAVTALGRLGGRTVGVVANNPIRLAGCLDAASGDKTGRFVQWCDALGIPLLFLVDVPGYLPGVSQEDGGVVRRGAKLLHAYAAASVPRVTVVLRKSFGGAFIAMGSKGLGADTVLAWEGAHVDVMGAAAAVEVLHRRDLAALTEPAERARLLAWLAENHEKTTGGLGRAVACGAVDAVIAPADTRALVLSAFAALPPGRGQHRNGPQ